MVSHVVRPKLKGGGRQPLTSQPAPEGKGDLHHFFNILEEEEANFYGFLSAAVLHGTVNNEIGYKYTCTEEWQKLVGKKDSDDEMFIGFTKEDL